MKAHDNDPRGKTAMMLAIGFILVFAGGLLAEVICRIIASLR